MAQPHALLGDIALELPTYMEGFEVRMAADFAEHPKVEQKPRLQWVGDRLDQIRLDAKLHAQFCTPEVELAKLRNALRLHEAMPLIFDNGHVVGTFVLTHVDQRSLQTMRDGTVLVAEVTLDLLEYTEDGKSTEEPASGTPVAAMAVGAGGGAARAPSGTVSVAAPGRAPGASAVRAGLGVV